MGIRQSPVCSGGIDLAPEGIESCRVESIRTSRPVGPSGQVLFDLVAKVHATSTVVDAETGMDCKLFGGSTISSVARVRYGTPFLRDVQRDRLAHNYSINIGRCIGKPQTVNM